MAKKRERLELIYDILKAISDNEKIGPTRLLYSSNLSPQMFKEYIVELTQKEFIFEKSIKNKRFYCLTKKGYEYLSEYKVIVDFVDNFGL